MRQSGITTIYRGIRFRSRLEARWAALFERLGWQWEYEPFDCDGYIPDFAILGGRPLLVEVKPDVEFSKLVEHGERVVPAIKGRWESDLLVVGSALHVPAPDSYEDGWVAGPLWQFGDFGFANGCGMWNLCRKCSAASVYHDQLWYGCRPCGHYDGDGYLAPIYDGCRVIGGTATRMRPAKRMRPDEDLRTAWNEATNAVQWQARQYAF